MKAKKKFLTSMGASMSLMLMGAQSVFAAGPDKSMYGDSTGSTQLDTAGNTLLKIVGGSGATVFALAFMIIGLFLAFGSLNPQRASALWKAFFICGGAAFIFFMAYALPGMFKGLAG
ncbi:hypothetical protein M5X11_12350 [Paenibacillus alginolyticus]|uniref:hypothetical protein n=1 Tax=Paenibacillus alginolyticus TaxID=59839 RepID=UPI0004216CA4|nr:hypothetical protein [Paenibacillus alginolyticus]MCY9665746.1 hypothetical protein [Paenibacillus alginolyticus]